MVPQSLGHLQVCTHAIIYDENGDMLACAVSNSFMIASVEVTEMWTYQLLPRETLLQLLSLLAHYDDVEPTEGLLHAYCCS